jgi:hypothetical protein
MEMYLQADPLKLCFSAGPDRRAMSEVEEGTRKKEPRGIGGSLGDYRLKYRR